MLGASAMPERFRFIQVQATSSAPGRRGRSTSSCSRDGAMGDNSDSSLLLRSDVADDETAAAEGQSGRMKQARPHEGRSTEVRGNELAP